MLTSLVHLCRLLPLGPIRPTLGAALWHLTARETKKIVNTEIGVLYDLELDEFVDRQIYLHGCYEPNTTEAIKKLVGPLSTILDVGANIGCHTCLFAKLAARGKVIAFEPMPWARTKLDRNIKVNGFNNVLVESRGVSNTSGVQTVHFRSSWKMKRPNGRSEESAMSIRPIEVHFTSIDEYCRDFDRLDLIKIDVDGYEAKVVRGAVLTITRLHPILILELSEYTLREAGDSVAELIDFLLALDYRVFNEVTFEPYRSRNHLLTSVPERSSINVVCASRQSEIALRALSCPQQGRRLAR